MLTIKRAGFCVEGFSDVEGLEFAVGKTRPFLVILDASLEKSDAVKALQKLSELKYDGAVQVLSGRPPGVLDDIRELGQARKLRMLDVVRKPCRLQAIRDLVEKEASLHLARPPSKAEPALAIRSRSERSRVVVSLEETMRDDRVEVWYQPKIDLTTGALVGAECLSRVRLPDGVIALPGAFTPGHTGRHEAAD